MSWLPAWFGNRAALPAADAARLAAWQALPQSKLDKPAQTARLVVVDCETSGLAPAADRLLSLGAVTLDAMKVDLAAGFEAVLRQQLPSATANIRVHGIGAEQQLGGEDPADALMRFLEWSAKAPLIAYHAPFDAMFIRRAMRQHLGVDPRLHWLDLAAILPPLFDAPRDLALDHWLERFGIETVERHCALGDALVTAQLAQIALRKAESRGLLHFAALEKLAAGARWLQH